MSRAIIRAAPGGHVRLAVLATLVPLLAGCTGATVGSGIGDTHLERPPYYASARDAGQFGGSIAHLPVSYQRGAGQAPIFEPSDGPGSPAAEMLADMNRFLDGMGRTVRLTSAAGGTPPDVIFGCERSPDDDCEEFDRRRPMRLAVGRPSRQWVDDVAAGAVSLDADRVLVITLEVGNYLPRYRDLLGRKEIHLGTGHTVDVPWLTAVDRPASVLQLTGVVVDRSGRALRIGAEGLLARRTNLLVASIGGQTLITDDDVERLRTARRDDLPGNPLVWQVALGELVDRLTR